MTQYSIRSCPRVKHITRLCRDDGKCPSRSLQRTQGPSGPLQQITQLKMLVISQHLALTVWVVVCMIFVALPQQQGATVSALQTEVKKKHSKENCRGSVDSCDLKCASFSSASTVSNILSVLKKVFLIQLLFAQWCLSQTECMHYWLHITVTTSWYITSVTQLKNLPRGQTALLGWELWPHSKVTLLNYVLFVFLKYSSALGTDRRSHLHTFSGKGWFVYLDRPHPRLRVLDVDNFSRVGNVQELSQAITLPH